MDKGSPKNTEMILCIGSLIIIILLIFLFTDFWNSSGSQMEYKPNNFGFSLEDAFNIMK